MLISKFTGGVLLIIGTSIGGGMLALPVSMAELGLIPSIFFLIFCWLLMTAGAFLVLEVNLRLPPGSNMITMAKSTLGLPGQIIAWISYLTLLYALLSAYISGGSDVLNALLQSVHIPLPYWITSVIFTLSFGLIVYSGIKAVDYVNRGLMLGKLGVYILLVLIISPYIDPTKLHHGAAQAVSGSLMILITSFGFASIVPSLRDYFQDDLVSLRRVILIGSFIPLVCYILWNAIIMGSIEHHKLLSLMSSDRATSELTTLLSDAVHNHWIAGFFSFFTSICMLTAFLGVSLGLFDFLADGLNLKKTGVQGKWILVFTFFPPLAIVLLQPGIYLNALRYAGTCCVILLLLLPSIMAWQSRKKNSQDNPDIPGGKIALFVIGILSVCLLSLSWIK